MTPRLPLDHARRLALHAQGLALPPPAGQSVSDVVARLGCLQLDPVGVVARSPLLVLRARLRGGTPRQPRPRAGPGRLPRPRAVRLLVPRGQPVPRGRPAAAPLGHAHLRRAPDPGARPPRALAGRQRRVRGAPGRRPPRARARARAGAGGSLGRGVGVGPLDRRGVLAPDHRADAGPAVDDGPRGHRRAGGPGAAVGRVRALRARPAEPERLEQDEVVRRAALRAVGMLGVARAPHITAHFTRRRYPGLAAALEQLERDGRLERVECRRAARRVVGAARGPGTGVTAGAGQPHAWRCRRSTT